MNYDELAGMLKQEYSTRYIAGTLGVSQSSVRYWIKKHGLQTYRGPKGSLPQDKASRSYKCKHCGTVEPDRFYGSKRFVCGACHNQYTIQKGRDKRLMAVEALGGTCVICGFNKYLVSLDIHHLDPTKKDARFKQMRGWSWGRIQNEIADCVLLCKNCHAALHAGLVDLQIDNGIQ